MLPVPYDQLITPIITYPQNSPPVVPPGNVHPEGMQLIIPAASMAANILGESAGTSTTRAFCYNLMARDNWNNPDFFNLVRLIVDYTVYKKYMNAVGNIHVTLQSVASEFAALYASYLAYNYQEYFVLLDPTTQARVMQNIQHFNDYAAKADSVYGMQPPAQHQVQHQRQIPQSMVMNRPQAHHGMHTGHTGFHYPAYTVHGGHRNMNSNPAVSGLSTASPSQSTRDPFIATKFGTVPRPQRVTQEVEQQNQGGSVDRNLHTLAYRGNTISVKAKPRTTTPVVPPKNINKVEAEDLIRDVGEFKEVISIQETNLATCFGNAEAQMSKNMKRGVLEVHPFELIVLAPMIASTATGTLFSTLKSCRTFSAVAKALNAYDSMLSALPPEKEDERYFGKRWLEKVDRYITSISNKYFQNAMPGDGFKFSSIREDGENLAAHVASDYRNQATTAFNAFQKNLFSEMFQSDAHGGNVCLPDLEEGEMKVIDYEILTTRSLLIYLTSTKEELGYEIDKMKTTVSDITKSELYDILFKANNIAKKMASTQMFIMTADGEKWVFYENAVEPNTFTIFQE